LGSIDFKLEILQNAYFFGKKFSNISQFKERRENETINRSG
jgi:hypothetical protein